MLRSLTLTPGFSAAAPIFAAASSITLFTSTAGFGAGGVVPWADAHAGASHISATTLTITDRISGSFSFIGSAGTTAHPRRVAGIIRWVQFDVAGLQTRPAVGSKRCSGRV